MLILFVGVLFTLLGVIAIGVVCKELWQSARGVRLPPLSTMLERPGLLLGQCVVIALLVWVWLL